jgi:hypothetical protein
MNMSKTFRYNTRSSVNIITLIYVEDYSLKRKNNNQFSFSILSENDVLKLFAGAFRN